MERRGGGGEEGGGEGGAASGEHITVEELHRAASASIDRSVSAATVYRTVNMLVEIGVAHKRDFGGSSASFESAVNKGPATIICLPRVRRHPEFHHDRIETLQDEVATTHGFRMSHHRTELHGVCAACQRAGAVVGGKPSVTVAET